METKIGSFTDKLINHCITEINKEYNKKKLYKQLISPIIDKLYNQYAIYALIFSIIIISSFILNIYTVYICHKLRL